MAFHENASAGDEALQQEVRSLLAQADAADTFLEAPAMEVAAKSVAKGSLDGQVGPSPSPAMSTIGRYRVLRPLGEGGMGAVYEAEQDQPRRTVALKIIKPGFATTETLRRFQTDFSQEASLRRPSSLKRGAG